MYYGTDQCQFVVGPWFNEYKNTRPFCDTFVFMESA